jgi:hypothetical protein
MNVGPIKHERGFVFAEKAQVGIIISQQTTRQSFCARQQLKPGPISKRTASCLLDGALYALATGRGFCVSEAPSLFCGLGPQPPPVRHIQDLPRDSNGPFLLDLAQFKQVLEVGSERHKNVMIRQHGQQTYFSRF